MTEKNSEHSNQASEAKEAVRQVPFDEAQAINAEPHEERVRALTPWRPEEAANFLAQTIRESQRPLTEALAQRGVPISVAVLAMVAALVLVCGLIFMIMRSEERLDQLVKNQVDSGHQLSSALQDQQEVVRLRKEMAELKEAQGHRMDGMKQVVAALEKKLAEAQEQLGQRDRSQEEVVEKSVQQIRKLQAQLDDQDRLGRRLAELEGKNRDLRADLSRQGRARKLFSAQAAAQTREVEALRGQLKVAQQLIATLQGDESPVESGAVQAAPAKNPEAVAEKAADEEQPTDETSETPAQEGRKDAVVPEAVPEAQKQKEETSTP